MRNHCQKVKKCGSNAEIKGKYKEPEKGLHTCPFDLENQKFKLDTWRKA
jgi:hypothetical protein